MQTPCANQHAESRTANRLLKAQPFPTHGFPLRLGFMGRALPCSPQTLDDVEWTEEFPNRHHIVFSDQDPRSETMCSVGGMVSVAPDCVSLSSIQSTS